MWEFLRWVTIFSSCLSIGTLVALYVRVERVILPEFAMTTLIGSNIALNLGVIGVVYSDQVVQLSSWRLLPFLLGSLSEILALVFLYWWYGTEEGKAHSMIMSDSQSLKTRWLGRNRE